MSKLFDYTPSGESISTCMAVLERGLERFAKLGRVVAKDRVSRNATTREPRAPRQPRAAGETKRRQWHKTKPISPEVRQQIGREYLGFETMGVIAKRHGCSICTVYKIAVEELGLPPRGPGRRSDLYRGGKSA